MALAIDEYLNLRDQIVDELRGLIIQSWMDSMAPSWFRLTPIENLEYEELHSYCLNFHVRESRHVLEHDAGAACKNHDVSMQAVSGILSTVR